MSGTASSGMPVSSSFGGGLAATMVLVPLLSFGLVFGTLYVAYGSAAFHCHRHTRAAPQEAARESDLPSREAAWAKAVNGTYMDPMATVFD